MYRNWMMVGVRRGRRVDMVGEGERGWYRVVEVCAIVQGGMCIRGQDGEAGEGMG